jgi:dihydrofolate synthase/folylpolyglutamate synthase
MIDNLLLRVGLRGRHQLENAAVVATVLRALAPTFPQITLSAVQTGIAHTVWAGRLQVLANNPTILVDGAHNGDSAQKLVKSLPAYFTYDKLWYIVGVSQGKDTVGILEAIGGLENAGIFLTQATHPRALPVTDLYTLAQPYFTHIHPTPDVATALTTALNHASQGDLICITGSLYIVGDLLNEWESIQSDA